MPVSDSNTHRSTRDTQGTREVTKRSACDRCRGQKLRCIRTDCTLVSCNRCLRAKAVCITAPMLPMGRPTHAVRKSQRRGSSTSSGRHNFGNSLLPDSSPSLARNISPQQANCEISNSALDNRQMDESMPMVREAFTRRDWNGDLGFDTPNFEVENLGRFNTLFHFGDDNDFASNHAALEFSPLSLTQASHPQDHLGSASGEIGLRETDSSLGDQSNDSATVMGPMADRYPVKKDIKPSSKSSDAYHASVEQLSHLSLEIYRLAEITETLAQDPTSAYDRRSFGQMETELRHPISSMIRGLRSFQELLRILGSQGRHYADTITNYALPASMVTPPSLPDASGLREAPNTPKRTRDPTDNPWLSSTREVHKKFSSNGESLSIPQQNERDKNREGCLQHLDLPTSLLVMTCYINLVRLCRHVFHNICRCLQTVEHKEISFAPLSDLQISGISLGQDGGMQILVLGQVVARLLDRISGWLGCPDNMVVGGVLKNEDHRRHRMLAPTLIEILQREEELQGPGLRGGGIQALKEEIRSLSEILDDM